MTTQLLLTITPVLVIGVLFQFLPRWTRREVFFTITVQPSFRDTSEARKISRQYRIEVWVHTAVALLLGAAAVALHRHFLLHAALWWQIVGASWALVRGRRSAIRFAVPQSPIREASLAWRREPVPGGWSLALGPFVLLALTAVYAYLNWENLPQRIVVHWGWNGPDRWVDRSVRTVAGLFLLNASLASLFLMTAYGTLNWTRRLCATGPAANEEGRLLRRVAALSLSAEYLIIMPLWFTLFKISGGAMAVWAGALLVTVIAMIWVMIQSGQFAKSLPDTTGSLLSVEQPGGDRTPDACWKLGLFYLNPGDAALFVEKRFGVGYTLNFGNPRAWLVLLAMLGPLGLSVFLLG